MAFGIKRQELQQWKKASEQGEIAFLTHYWVHPKDPTITTVTKVACSSLDDLIGWGAQYQLKEEWIHQRHPYPHFDLIGEKQREILYKEKLFDHIQRFSIQ